jgi:hypothetical protein
MRRRPRLVDFLTAFLLVGGVALSAAPRAAERTAGTAIRDLYYGEVLYHFYQQDDFTALTHLRAAQQAGRVSHHESEAELLLGGLYLSYGQHTRAGEIFTRLLAQNPDPETRDRAWFYLGKMRYQRGLYPEALQAFARVGKNLPEALAVELPMLIAESHMARGEFQQAADLLAGRDGPSGWRAYAHYNLGVALVRLNRVTDGASLLDEVGRMSATTPEAKSLRDKANLALGYAYLQANDGPQARAVLQRVRLQGPFSTKALLGFGWADAIARDYRGALVPWSELLKRDLLDSAVQESFLAVPFALGKLNAAGDAVDQYQVALKTFDTELTGLDAAIGRARSGQLIPAVLNADDQQLGRWYWQLKRLPDTSESRYLYHLMADHAFQEGLKNFRDLTALSTHLEEWRQKIEIYDNMVNTRTIAYRQRLPETEGRLARVDIQSLQQRRDGLAERVRQVEESRDVSGFATPPQLDQWRRLNALEESPAWPAPQSAEIRDRQRILKGVLQWDLDRDFKLRSWREHRALRQLDQAIAQAEVHARTLADARGSEPVRLEAFRERIAALTPRITAMQTAIGGTLRDQEQGLLVMAVAELESQKRRLASYRVQARFALANIYDRAGAAPATAALPKGQP